MGIVGLGGLLLTASRSGLVAIAVAVAILGGRLVYRLLARPAAPGWLRVGGPLAYLALLLGLVWAVWQVVRRWLEGGTSDVVLDTFQGRLELWQRALYMVQDVPFTGIGIGQFNPVLQAFYPTFLASPTRIVPHAHNVYLSYAVELGVPGALAFAALVGLAVWHAVRAFRSTDIRLSWAGFGLGLGVLSFLIYGLTDAIAPGARAGIVLWIVLGLATASGRISTNAQPAAQELHSRRAPPSGASL
jgi:putative inorganic carbon (HCO3(-)) transporter